MKPFAFADGTKIPPGEILSSPIGAIHMDENIYENPQEFNGFRFSKMREREGESAKHHSVNTSREFLIFGHGEHAWYKSSNPC